MAARCETRLPQRLGGEQPAEPGRMLQDLQIIPGVEQQGGAQHRRQTFGLGQHDAPFIEPDILIPIEIVDQQIFFGPSALGGAGPPRLCDDDLRSGEQRIDDANSASNGLAVCLQACSPSPPPTGDAACHAYRGPSGPSAQPSGCVERRGDRQFVSARSDIMVGVVQRQVLEVDVGSHSEARVPAGHAPPPRLALHLITTIYLEAASMTRPISASGRSSFVPN